MKKCSKCSKREGKLISKPFCQFNKDKSKKSGYYSSCKDCCTVKFKEWYEKDNNKQLCNELGQLWRLNNPDRKKQMDKEYRTNNKIKINKYFQDKYENDEIYRTTHLLRNQFKDFFSGRRPNNVSVRTILDCSISDFHTWIMFSNNYCVPLIPSYDHIIPCNFFKRLKASELENSYEICFHWSNYRSCNLSENIKKKDNIDLTLIEEYNKKATEFIKINPHMKIPLEKNLLLKIISSQHK